MSDLKQINGQWYDFGCKNESFLITANELRLLGIKNYYFMLRIDNPRLADIDPFNPKITQQEVTALMIEYRKNPWMFRRTAVRMRTDKGIVPFGLHRGLAAALWNFDRNQDFCLNEPRQTWKTTGTLAGGVLYAFQLSQNLKVHFFGKETENTQRNLMTLRDDIELLPEWLQFSKFLDSEGKIKKAKRSATNLENTQFHNSITIHPKPASLSHAQGMGRGGSGAILYFDEIEHTPYFGEILSNSAPLFKTASENAAAVGNPYCRIFTTTPGNLDTREGMESLPIIKSMIPWTEKIYDMTEEEIKNYKSAFMEDYHNSEEKHTREVIDVFYLEYQYYQVRKDFNWVKQQYALSGDKMAIRREILLQRLRGSNNSPISPQDIEYLISNMKKSDQDVLINGKWRFRIYDHGQGYRSGVLKDFEESIPYIVGVDPAAGGGGDNFAVVVINPYNLKVAAEFKSPYMGQTPAVQMLITLVQDYIPNCCIVIEKNSMGIYLIQTLVDSTSIKDNLYWSEKEADKQLADLTNESDDEYRLKALAAQYKKYGTYNTPKVRKGMLEILFRHVEECKEILNTEYLVDDICKLVRTSTGRIEAVKGEHDDVLFAYLHAMNIYYNGDNIENWNISRLVHPILGAVEVDLDKKVAEGDPFKGFFSTEQVTFTQEVMDDAARQEEEIKEMVDKLPFVHDSIYSSSRDDSDPFGGNVQLSSHFFDQLNGF
ncbi:MAG: hypothetical protein NC548_39860 [Lachnospiraceae bacterium]|nr:hypothetical protein [Lachnospiraceae bacterium]